MGAQKEEVTHNGHTFDPMGVTWSERYSDKIAAFWSRIPDCIGKALATLAVFALGVSINGDWINIGLHVGRQFGWYSLPNASNSSFNFTNIQESLHLQNFVSFWIPSVIVSYALYFLIGGFLHWYYYVRQRDRAEEWKCQPNKWLPPELERHEIILGSCTLMANSTVSGLLACYIANGGRSTVYYNISDYGWIWFFVQFAVVFIYQDYTTYWLHRIYHMPFLYKHFHKLHHKYKQPTAFSVTAIHPVEAVSIQIFLCLPLFLIPIHWLPFYIVALYTYYHGIIDHSGINFKSYWWQPWQPDAIFHDNHHQYFHVNYAFNIEYWDKLHGTYRKKDRVYTEDTYFGGKSLKDVTEEELKADLEERSSENPLAYRGNKLHFALTKDEVKHINATKANNKTD